MERGGKSPCITVMQGKLTTVLEMEHPVVDFITICESPWASGMLESDILKFPFLIISLYLLSDMQEPYAIAVLLQNDLVLIDLLTPDFPCFESPYPMDLHESPVTSCTYLSDCPSDLVPAFYSVIPLVLPIKWNYGKCAYFIPGWKKSWHQTSKLFGSRVAVERRRVVAGVL